MEVDRPSLQSLASRVQIRWIEMKAIVSVKTIAYESIISF